MTYITGKHNVKVLLNTFHYIFQQKLPSLFVVPIDALA